MEYSGLSTFFVILAIVMHEATVYQNLTQLSIRKAALIFCCQSLLNFSNFVMLKLRVYSSNVSMKIVWTSCSLLTRKTLNIFCQHFADLGMKS